MEAGAQRTGRVLIGGIGYRFLRDGSVGPWVVDELEGEAGDGLEVEDISYHPVGLHQNLTDREPYDRAVIVAGVGRGREPASITTYRWDGELPDPEEIQRRVSEAVTGVVSLDNHLIVCGALGGWPDDVLLVEVEPVDESWGEGFSPEVAAKREEILEVVRSAACISASPPGDARPLAD